MELFIEFLHVVPLLIIALLYLTPHIANFFFKKKIIISSFNSIVLVLSAIGIAAGNNAHHAFEHLIDPCFGYATILIVMSIKLAALPARAIAR